MKYLIIAGIIIAALVLYLRSRGGSVSERPPQADQSVGTAQSINQSRNIGPGV